MSSDEPQSSEEPLDHDPYTPREIDPEPVVPRLPEQPAARRARRVLAAIVLALFAAILVVKLVTRTGQEQTAFFYVGVPAVIALTVILAARPRSAVGIALATTTIGLALAGPLLDEGVVCLVIAAPLFYGVAAIVGVVVGDLRERRTRRRALAVTPLLLLALVEGVGGSTLVPREDAGTAIAVVDAAPADFARSLAAPPTYGDFEAVFLRAVPFPEPVSATGTGLAVGDERVVTFTPRRSLGLGAQPTPRSMTLHVVESEVSDAGGRLVLDVTEDTTLARWMDLRSAEVTWEAAGAGTRVTWTLHFTRTFDPSWYFGPLQHWTTGLASDYLIDTFAGPAEELARTRP